MANSINTNIAAYYAQRNINYAATQSAASVSRLSSGNRIVQASDDVAGLAIGTSLATAVSTLRTALTNASQGVSLLQVADGGLAKIIEILTRQKSISVQATSGTLSDAERGYLNQEFQALASEIDRLTVSTKFNQVAVLDGSLSGSTAITNNALNNAVASNATAGLLVTITVPVNGDRINIAGLEIEFSSAAPGTTGADGKVSIGAAATNTAQNLVKFLNESSDPRLANLKFSNAAGVVSGRYAGGTLDGAFVLEGSSIVGTNAVFGTAANRTFAVVAASDGLGVDRTALIGTFAGSLLTTGGLTAGTEGSPLEIRTVFNNKDFVGKLGTGNIGQITGVYTGVADTVVLSLKVGDFTYATTATDISNVAATVTTLTFTGTDTLGVAGGGTFNLVLAGAAIAANQITGQGDLDPIVAQLNDALADITFVQNRDVTSFQEGELVVVGGIQVGSLNGLSVNYRSDDFSGVNIESIKITAPPQGATDALIEVYINGELYRSTGDIGNLIQINTQVTLQSVNNPQRSLSFVAGATAIVTSTTTALDLSNQTNADAIQKAFEDAFGITDAGARVNFQVGNASNEIIGVQVESVETENLYDSLDLNVSTLLAADEASTQLDIALDKALEARSNVGALQSRFAFASASIESGIQNLDAARSALLDTDIATESTAYANSQVKLQAGISVLAQANLQLQALLKLIG